LRCSLYRWKGLEVLISKMALHEPFGHLQHKLWSKEGLGDKLTVWFPTTKSRESTRPWCVQVECETPLESSWEELQVFFRPHPNQRSELGVMSSQSLGSPIRDSFKTPLWESNPRQFQDSSLGIPGLKAIRMQVRRNNAENTIWGKVVASPKFKSWWVKWVRVARGLSQHQEWFRMWSNQLVGWFWYRTK
jgi:hypothetical protein